MYLNNGKFLLIAMFLIVGTFVSSFNFEEKIYGLELEDPTTITFDNNTININNSQYLQGYTPTTLKDWIQGLFDSVYCKLTGCTMAGDIDMDGNNILNVGNISLQFGDLVSELNPYAGNAIRLKGTGDDVDIVLGDSTGYFSIWDVTDTAPVFSIDNQGDIVTTGGAIFNENSADRNFRIESNDNEYMLFVDGEENRVGIGTTSPTHKLNVVGSVNITGNLTAENVHLPVYISSHTNNTIAVASAGVWYNVTFDQGEDEFKKRITHTTNDNTNTTFTIQDTGIYEITYTMSFQDSAVVPTSHIVIRVTKDNVELNGFTIEEDLGIKDQDKTLHHSDLVGLVAGEKIVLSFTSDDTTVSLTSHLTYGIHKNTAHLTIKRIA